MCALIGNVFINAEAAGGPLQVSCAGLVVRVCCVLCIICINGSSCPAAFCVVARVESRDLSPIWMDWGLCVLETIEKNQNYPDWRREQTCLQPCLFSDPNFMGPVRPLECSTCHSNI